MKKELFTEAEVDIILFDRLDVITESCPTYSDPGDPIGDLPDV